MKIPTLLIASMAAATIAAAATYSSTEKFTQSYPISPTGELVLENVNGSVSVVAWDKNEILLEAEKRARTDDDLQRIIIHVNPTSERLTVNTEYQKTGWFRSQTKGEVHYKLKVPAGISVQRVHAVNASITISGVRGSVTADTVNGGINVDGLTADALLKSVNGSVTARASRGWSGRALEAKTVNGSCRLTLPSNVAANLHAKTVNGRINSTLPVDASETRHNRLEGRIGAGSSANIQVTTVNGDISLECD